jgi:hypothetical protein
MASSLRRTLVLVNREWSMVNKQADTKNIHHSQLPIDHPNVQVSDTTGDDSSNTACSIKIILQ